MRKNQYWVYGICFVLILCTYSGFAAERKPLYSPEIAKAQEAAVRAFSEIGLPKGNSKPAGFDQCRLRTDWATVNRNLS